MELISMEKMNYIIIYLFLNFYPAFSLYADQIGKFDWLQQYIGPVEKIVFDSSSSPSRRVIVSTSHNVLAALSTKSGDILWRHIFEANEAGKIEALVANNQFVTVLTGGLIRTLDVISAALQQEVSLDISPAWGNISRKLFSFSKTRESIFGSYISDSTVEVAEFDVETGSVVKKKTLEAPWIQQNMKCIATSELLVCLDLQMGVLQYVNLSGGDNFHTLPLKALGLNANTATDGLMSNSQGSEEHFTVQVGAKKILVHAHHDGIHFVKDISSTPIGFIEEDTYFSVTQRISQLFIEASELTSENEITELGFQVTLPIHSGSVESLFVYKFERKDGGTLIRAVVTCSDQSVHYISSGGIQWTRQESLSNIISVEAIDLPKAGAAESYNDQLSYKAGILSSFVHRIRTQINQISNLRHLAFRAASDFGDDSPTLERDQFNQHKILLVVTKRGKVFGIDNVTGRPVWCIYLPMFSTFDGEKALIFSQRTSAHFPQTPQTVLVFKDKFTGNGALFTFNPLNGEEIYGGIQNLDYSIVQASLLQQYDSDYIKPVLLVASDKSIHVYPASGVTVINQFKDSLYVYLTAPNSSVFTGYSLKNSKPGNLVMSEVWSIDLSKNGVITGVYGKRSGEDIHSPGRVLADRSVLYKYGNPNLVVVTTYGTDALNKNMLTVYLIDTITGSILESVSHKRVAGPFHFVHSENWVIYTMYNDKFRRNEITTLELFEGLEQSNATAFSSFGARSTPPIVERQAFILPQGIQAASHTTTEKGITTKFVLFALNSGSILQISKWFLDPRRPIAQGGPHEEGLVPYMPEIPLHPQEMINYNKTLPRVRAIYTAPTGLESTCLVFAYGLDLYYTRVFPSKMFDVLKDDFDHYLIIGVLLCLISASFITRKLAQRKALKQAWK